ncbi:MAG: amidohydrolase family protein [Sciscionella sp.]|nr:amidohydrolase family protein [Sciscionella sp.]
MSPRTIFGSGQVFDVCGGTAYSAELLCENGRIIDIGTDLNGDEFVDCSGLTLLPGFIDCHIHVGISVKSIENRRSLRRYAVIPVLSTLLSLGITAIRDAWGADAGVREAVELGYFPGPRIQVSLRQLSPTGGIGDHYLDALGAVDFFGDPSMPNSVFDGPIEARAAVFGAARLNPQSLGESEQAHSHSRSIGCAEWFAPVPT